MILIVLLYDISQMSELWNQHYCDLAVYDHIAMDLIKTWILPSFTENLLQYLVAQQQSVSVWVIEMGDIGSWHTSLM